jgi:hypothetical protein
MIEYSKCVHIRRNPDRNYFPRDLDLGLGDYVEAVLDKMGITKERWAAAASAFKEESSSCGKCQNRQNFLNWIGSHIGMSPGQEEELRKDVKSMTFSDQPIRCCTVHGRCIGHEEFAEPVVEAIKKQGIQPCQHCSDFQKE